MKLAIIGVIINLFITLMIYIGGLDTDYHDQPAEVYSLLFYPAVFFWLISVVGLVLVLRGVRKKGAILLIMVGCIFFIPIGLIGYFGGAQLLKKIQSEALDAHRLQESQSNPGDMQGANNESSKIKVYHARHQLVLMMSATLAVILIMLVTEIRTGAYIPSGIFILVLIIQVIKYYSPAVTLGEDDIKVGMGLARKNNLLFSEIKEYEIKKNKMIFHYQLTNGNQSGKTSLHLSGMTPEVREEFLRDLLPKLISNSIHERA